MSCLKNAELFTMPSLSGYGPAVSSGDTAHVPELVVPPVEVEPLDVVEGVVGDEPHAAATAAAAALSAPKASRRVSLRCVGVMSLIASFMRPIEPDECCRSVAAVSKDCGARFPRAVTRDNGLQMDAVTP